MPSRRPRYLVPALILCAFTATASAGVIPLSGQAPDGRSYSDLVADWWKWAISIPEPQSPLIDHFGDNTYLNQSGPVFFLAPSLDSDSTRSITLSEDKYLFFPVVTTLALNAPGETYTEAEMRQQLNEFHGVTSVLYATVDEVQVPDLWTYRASSPAGGFTVNVPEDNIFGLDAGTYGPPAVGDGFWLLLEPLSIGEHTIHFEGSTGDPGNPTLNQNTTYLISVPEPSSAVLLCIGGLLCLRRRRIHA